MYFKSIFYCSFSFSTLEGGNKTKEKKKKFGCKIRRKEKKALAEVHRGLIENVYVINKIVLYSNYIL